MPVLARPLGGNNYVSRCQFDNNSFAGLFTSGQIACHSTPLTEHCLTLSTKVSILVLRPLIIFICSFQEASPPISSTQPKMLVNRKFKGDLFAIHGEHALASLCAKTERSFYRDLKFPLLVQP